MKVIIVDDEPLARQIIETIILEQIKGVKIVGQAGDVNQAIKVIETTKPDLVFLDVDIIGGSGFDVLKKINSINFKVIFITAHQKYAIQAIKFSAFDFILKPVSQNELVKAVLRAKDELKDNNAIKWEALFGNLSDGKNKARKIVLKTSDSIHLVNVADIIRCEADNNYSTFYLNNKVKIVISKGLKEYEELLSDYGFFRVHQSHLVNVNFITRFDKKEGGSIILTDQSNVPVSQRKKQKLLELFEQIQ